MPKQAIAYLTVIILAGIGSLLLTANLLKVEKSWSNALVKVRDKNTSQAATLVAQRRKAAELQAALAQANLGWDRLWDQVQTTPNPQNGTLQVKIGSDNGITATAEAPQILHAFQPGAEGFTYIGPFLAKPENVRNADATLVPGWQLLLGENAPESATWKGGPWRFRTQVPAEAKVRFESLVSRFATNFQTLGQKRASINKQEGLFKAAEAQLEQRNSELIGVNDPDVEVDPLRPELTKGLVAALEEEEEGRNILQLDVDELRRAILEVKEENEQLENEIRGGSSGALGTAPPRIGSRPK